MKWLNCKLYNQYYPLKTEEEKYYFLRDNYTELIKITDTMRRISISSMACRKSDYAAQMKNETPLFGNPHYNKLHNQRIVDAMNRDVVIQHTEQFIYQADIVSHKLIMGDHDNITVKEINTVLKEYNDCMLSASVKLIGVFIVAVAIFVAILLHI